MRRGLPAPNHALKRDLPELSPGAGHTCGSQVGSRSPAGPSPLCRCCKCRQAQPGPCSHRGQLCVASWPRVGSTQLASRTINAIARSPVLHHPLSHSPGSWHSDPSGRCPSCPTRPVKWQHLPSPVRPPPPPPPRPDPGTPAGPRNQPAWPGRWC